MAAHRQGLWSTWSQNLQELTGFRRVDKAKSDKRHSHLRFETLETRVLLASDLSAISGLVYRDVSGNGYDAGEQLAGAVVQLYRDNGDGVFSPATDSMLSSKTTGIDGKYRFDNLTAGNYFVQQQSITAGIATLPAVTSQMITITAADADGQMYTMIDSFDTTLQIAKANSGNRYATSTAQASEALGGYRKLVASLDQVYGTVALSANDPDSGMSRLDFSATSAATGSRRVTWDGTSSSADATNYTGLGGIDLTKGGQNTGIATAIGADKVGTITMRLYTDANNYSTATIQIPNTGGSAITQVYVPFSSFVATAGVGASLTNIGAIQLDVAADSAAADGQIDAIGAVGPTVKSVNFNNLTVDLALTKTVNNTSPQVNSQVTFAITVNNTGATNATGVQVQDLLPAGLGYVSSSATQGSYNSTTGVWSVGNVAKGGSQTLTIVATVLTPGARVNTAQVSAADQVDIDSIPGNNNPNEDDQASVQLSAKSADLALTKTVNNASANVGDDVTFTVVVRNDGPEGATGVEVMDQLPAGLTYKSSTAASGTTYNQTTGVWEVGSLAPGATATLTIVATVASSGSKTNTAQVWKSNEYDVDSTPGNSISTEDDQASVQVVPKVVDLSVDKTVDNPTPFVNQSVTFAITVRNDGQNNATGVTVTDVLPSGLVFQSFTSSVGTYSSATGLWTVGNLASGQSATLNIIAKVTTQGTKVNTAEVATANEFDIDSTPGNNNPTEDDQASAAVEPLVPLPAPPPVRFSKLRFLAR
jgi:uncharacterized repeat protein (TIGR01451 family)